MTEINNTLYLTSHIFITNALAAIYKMYYLYGFLFICLTISSLYVHSNKEIYNNQYNSINRIDKFIIACIVLTGGYIFYKNFTNKNIILNGFIIITFLISIWLYFIICSQKTKRTTYHTLLHVIGSIGHHCILF